MANIREIQTRINSVKGRHKGNSDKDEEHPGYNEDYKCHVYDFFDKDASGKEKTG